MRRLVAISRILLLAGLLIGPGWACCCGPDENRCDAPPDSLGATMQNVRAAWVQYARLAQNQALAAAPAVSVCAPSAEDGCACWKPRQPDSSLPSALASPFFEQTSAEPPLTIVVDPPRRVAPIRQIALAPPPLRPPIEGQGWSHALLPLPPPFQV